MSGKTRSVTLLRYFKFILGVLAIIFIVTFVLENQEAVSLQFLGWLMPKLPVSFYMLLSLLVGLVVGPLFGWYVSLRRSRG